MQTKMRKNKIKIGSVEIDSCVSLAPMAGITDFVLRQLIRKRSKTCLLETEMISSEAIVRHKETLINYTNGKEAPVAFQIEGHKPDLMAEASKLLENKASIIDINMGCPINKIVKGQDGCSLMRTPGLAKDIVTAVKESVKVPVTCKFRLGWSQEEKNFVKFAQLMQEAGASAVTVHGRTRSQMYGGSADWAEIARLKGNIDIPYFANGDIINIETAEKCLEISKAGGIAVGRAVMGDLSLISRIEKYLNDGVILKEPSLNEKLGMIKEHLDFQISFRGEENGIKFIRKFYPYYIKGVRNGAGYRYRLVTEQNYNNIIELLEEIAKNECGE